MRDAMELADRPDASESMEEFESVRFMKDGRGGAREPNDMTPRSSTRISRLDVSARVDNRS